jgi:hypothetical protein
MLVSFFAHSSNLKMEAKFSSETLVDFRRPSRHYVTDARTLLSLQRVMHRSSFFYGQPFYGQLNKVIFDHHMEQGYEPLRNKFYINY